MCRGERCCCPHLVGLGVVEEVGPVGIRLHEPELKQLPETQLQDAEADLQRRGATRALREGESQPIRWHRSHQGVLPPD